MIREFEDSVRSRYVTFDPSVEEHMEAFYQLRWCGKQSSLRFHLETPFLDVMAMMLHKTCAHHLRNCGYDVS